MHRRLVVAALGLAMVLGIASAAGAADRSTDAGSRVLLDGATATEASPKVGPRTVITGVVTKNGKPVGNADVLLIAWPNYKVLDAMPAGESVKTKVVARTAANHAGRFAVSLDPAHVGSRYWADTGAQLEVVVADATHEVFWEFTASPADAGQRGRGLAWGNPRIDQEKLLDRPDSGVGATHVAIDIGERPSVRELGDEPEQWIADPETTSTLGARGAAAHAAATRGERRPAFDKMSPASTDASTLAGSESTDVDARAPGGGWCATNDWQNGRSEKFIRSVGTIQAKNWVDQTTNSEHTLGIAFKGSGGWSQSGTQSRKTGVFSSDYRGPNITLKNKVNYRKYIYCDGRGWIQWRAAGIHSLGESIMTHSKRPAWNKPGHCTTYSTGTKKKETGSNKTFAGGVDLSQINVSAKASYSRNTVQRWEFSGRARLCGSTTSGWVSSPQAGAYIP